MTCYLHDWIGWPIRITHHHAGVIGMTCYPIAQQHLCDQFRAAIAEALRAGVPLETVQMALAQAHDELAMHAARVPRFTAGDCSKCNQDT